MASKKKAAKKAVKKAVKKTAVKSKSKQVKKAKPSKKATSKKAAKKTGSKKTAKIAAKKTGKASSPVKAQASVRPAVAAAPKVKAPPVDYTKAITPLMDRLVVRVLNGERVTAGGLLIIPDTALMATGYLKAEVLAVGTGTKSKRGYLKPLDVKIGDKVLFAEYAGTKVQFNSEELHIIHEADVMGILEE